MRSALASWSPYRQQGGLSGSIWGIMQMLSWLLRQAAGTAAAQGFATKWACRALQQTGNSTALSLQAGYN